MKSQPLFLKNVEKKKRLNSALVNRNIKEQNLSRTLKFFLLYNGVVCSLWVRHSRLVQVTCTVSEALITRFVGMEDGHISSMSIALNATHIAPLMSNGCLLFISRLDSVSLSDLMMESLASLL